MKMKIRIVKNKINRYKTNDNRNKISRLVYLSMEKLFWPVNESCFLNNYFFRNVGN